MNKIRWQLSVDAANDGIEIGMVFTSLPLQQGCNHSQRLSAPHAADGANLICVRAAEALPRAWV
jgi:hypothetical protein